MMTTASTPTAAPLPAASTGGPSPPRRRGPFLWVWTVCGLLGAPPGAVAADAAALPTEQDFLEDVPVVLSATRLPQGLAQSPAPVTVIDRDVISASGAREVHELLRLVPGFQVASESGLAHVATYHGLSDKFARRLQVLVDGRSVYSPAVGGVEWTEIPLAVEDIERIEVVRGANGATHGANAVVGVINIVTRVPSDYPSLGLRVHRGQDGIADALVQHGGELGELDYRVSAAYETDDGFESRRDTKHVRMASLRADYQLDPATMLEMQLGYSEGPRQQGIAGDPFFSLSDTDRTTRFQMLRWHRVYDTDQELTVQAYHNHSSRDGVRTGALFVPEEDDAGAERYDVEAFGLFRLRDDLRGVAGAGLRRDSFYGELFLGSDETLDNDMQRVFGNLEWRASPGVLVHAGAMWESSQLGGDNLDPRLAVNVEVRPGHTVRAGVSKAHRNPLFFEQEADLQVTAQVPPFPAHVPLQVFDSAGDVEPEWVLSREIGYVAQAPGKRLVLDVRLFHDRLSQLIFTVPSPAATPAQPTQRWDNVGEAEVTGIEGHLNWRPTARLRLLASYSYAEVDSDRPELEESTPRHTASLFALYRLPGEVSLSGLLYVVDDQRWLSEGTRVSGYERLDLRVAKGFRLGASRGEVALVGKSLTGGHPDFLERDGFNEFDTRAFVTVQLAL